MQAVAGDERRIVAARDRGDVDPLRARARGFFAIDRVELIDLACDLRAVASFRERRHAPIGNRHDDDVLRVAAGESDRALQQRDELRAIFVRAASAILIVDADQQRDALEWTLWIPGIDRGIQLVGGPAGLRDDPRLAELQLLRELHGKALRRVDALADRVRIAEGETAGKWVRVHRRP